MTTAVWTKRTNLNNNGAYVEHGRNSVGGNTPHADLIAGRFNENGYTSTRWYTLNEPILTNHLGGIPTNVIFASGGYKSSPSPAEPSNIEALARLLGKYKQSDFNLAVSAGESRESWHMIADRMFRFGEALRRTRNGDLTGALRAMGSSKRASRRAQRKLGSGDISGSFLELQYGWVPLINDIYAASELINEPLVEKSSIRTSLRTTSGDFQTAISQAQSQSVTHQRERTVYHIAKLSTTEVTWAARLGLLNPLSVAWELTTLSFVADWFLPIGSLIEAVEASYILPVGKYIKTDVLRTFVQLTIGAGAPCWNYSSTGAVKAQKGGIFSQKRTEMTRNISNSVPNNLFDGSGPRQSLIDTDLSLRQAASASALLHQAFQAFRR
jgi:hypothetical protein